MDKIRQTDWKPSEMLFFDEINTGFVMATFELYPTKFQDKYTKKIASDLRANKVMLLELKDKIMRTKFPELGFKETLPILNERLELFETKNKT